jgi:hypothetical protein
MPPPHAAGRAQVARNLRVATDLKMIYCGAVPPLAWDAAGLTNVGPPAAAPRPPHEHWHAIIRAAAADARRAARRRAYGPSLDAAAAAP